MSDMQIQLTDNSEAVKEAVREAVERALTAVGMHIEGEAKEELSNDPKRIDTGLLRNSITYAVSGHPAGIKSYHADFGSNRTAKGNRVRASSKNAGSVGFGSYSGNAPEEPNGWKAVYIGTNTDYGGYVHEGTVKMAPNRFLKNAVEKNRDQIKRIIENELKTSVNGL